MLLSIIGVVFFLTRKRYVNKYEQAMKVQEYQFRKTIMIRDEIISLGSLMLQESDQQVILTAILEKAVRVIDNADSGSVIFIKDDGYCEFISAVGFDMEDLKDVELKIEDTFLYRETNGKMDRAHIVNNIMEFNVKHNIPIELIDRLDNAGVIEILSTISVPIIIGEKVTALLNLDSLKPNAFDEEDVGLAEVFVSKASLAMKNHQLFQETIQLSRFDSLTGLYNQRFFKVLLEDTIDQCMQQMEPFLIVQFDIKGLRTINSEFGHLAGDGLLKYFATHMESKFKNVDYFGRNDGAELIGVIHQMSDEELIGKLNDLKKWFDENPYVYGSNRINFSFSFGIVEFGLESTKSDELIQTASDRMNLDKRK